MLRDSRGVTVCLCMCAPVFVYYHSLIIDAYIIRQQQIENIELPLSFALQGYIPKRAHICIM